VLDDSTIVALRNQLSTSIRGVGGTARLVVLPSPRPAAGSGVGRNLAAPH
jgi:hypothetical protein